MLVKFFSSKIPLYIGKNLVEKLCKVLEMVLTTYTPVSLKFAFEKIKFKVLHYIQHNFICQYPGFSKDQISMFKSHVINYFILKFCHNCNGYIKGDKYFFFRWGTHLYITFSVCPSVRPSICRTPYLRSRTSSNHDFWYTCVKWWYLQVFFLFSEILIFWAVSGVNRQKIAQNEK